ncbi:MAG: insulinase family protein [Bacilli bacterium]|nr:insulinase family protein [Bacilli bacterium]
MTKCETCVLKNGIRLVLCEDQTKNRTFMKIIVNYGGAIKKIKYDGKEYDIIPGAAHLLEHTLIEASEYGNMFDYLSDKYVSFNATTSSKLTSFYMDTVSNAYDRLLELINVVNNASFNDELLDNTKAPVLEEIRMGADRQYEEFAIASINSLLTQNVFINNLGTLEDITKIDSEYLKFIHSVFYRPENQVIALSGNFDSEKVKRIIEDAYDKIEFDDSKYELLDKHEDDEVSKDYVKIIKPDLDEIIKMSFKINIGSLTPKERVKLSFYISFFLDYNFDDSSDLFKTIKKENLSPYSVNRNINTMYDDYIILSFTLYGNNVDRFKELVLDIIDKKPFDEEMFELMKKENLINLINRNDHCSRMLAPFVANVVDFKYYDVDKLSDIEEFTVTDYQNTLNSLDFSHYTICVQTKE